MRVPSLTLTQPMLTEIPFPFREIVEAETTAPPPL